MHRYGYVLVMPYCFQFLNLKYVNMGCNVDDPWVNWLTKEDSIKTG